MLVVMLVSSLSIGISYTCYTLFSNHYLQYKKNSDELADYILVDKLLTRDISEAKKVTRQPNGIVCIKRKESIQYDFTSSYVLRRGIVVDTFFVKESSPLVCKRKGQLENIPEALIDEIELEVVYKEEKLYFYYDKEYGADVLILNE